MSLRERLEALARGDAAGGLLLNTCRVEWAGAEAYGEEAIAELFRNEPMAFGDGAVFVRTATGAALVDADQALVADLYGEHVGRLWRIGAGGAPEAEPAVAVAFDPDLRQHRGDVYVRREDHPELAPDDLDRITKAGQRLVAAIEGEPLHRARAFVVRAFSADGAAALYAVHRLSGGATRQAGFGYAVAAWAGDRAALLHDQRRPLPWTPRL